MSVHSQIMYNSTVGAWINKLIKALISVVQFLLFFFLFVFLFGVKVIFGVIQYCRKQRFSTDRLSGL